MREEGQGGTSQAVHQLLGPAIFNRPYPEKGYDNLSDLWF